MENKPLVKEINFRSIRPYGDSIDDGMIQLSFTLPVPCNENTRMAGRKLAMEMGLEEPDVVHMSDLGCHFTFMILYGKLKYSLDYTEIENIKPDFREWTQEQVEKYISERIKRDVVVVGACTGTDAHTVGIDAIINMKGFDGHYGLERYRGFRTYNLGGNVPNRVLLERAMEVNADAVLVSQIITHKRLHVHNLTELVDLMEAEKFRDRVILVCGGPRISEELAKELGYDKGFSKGCYPNQVASYIVQELARKIEDGTVR
jgi:beta-lysine 5,6-aminomutase beta subunit